ncbi:hypothetical protein Bca4012_060328 [Brassica carinata]
MTCGLLSVLSFVTLVLKGLESWTSLQTPESAQWSMRTDGSFHRPVLKREMPCKSTLPLFKQVATFVIGFKKIEIISSSGVRRLVAQAAIYSLWHERNNRLHNNISFSSEVIFKLLDRRIENFGGVKKASLITDSQTSQNRPFDLLCRPSDLRLPIFRVLFGDFCQRVCSNMSGRKETVLDLAKFVDKGVQVKLTGGRQVTGTLKGYDQLLNLVLDGAVESVRDHDDPLKTTDQTRPLGLIVCRGTAVMLVSPTDGTEEIANPFVQPEAI